MTVNKKGIYEPVTTAPSNNVKPSSSNGGSYKPSITTPTSTVGPTRPDPRPDSTPDPKPLPRPDSGN